MILEYVSNERCGLAEDRGIWHVSEIVPLVLAKVRTETQSAWESHPRASVLPSNIMPSPSVSVCV